MFSQISRNNPRFLTFLSSPASSSQDGPLESVPASSSYPPAPSHLPRSEVRRVRPATAVTARPLQAWCFYVSVSRFAFAALVPLPTRREECIAS